MRVLFYNTDCQWTGSGRALAAAASGLRQRGHDVAYVCVGGSAVERRLDGEAFEVVPLATDGPWPVVARQLRRVLLDRSIEVIFVHTEREQLIAAGAARLAERLRERAAVLRRVQHGRPATTGRLARSALKLAPTGFIFAAPEEAREAPVLVGARIDSSVVPLGVEAAGYDALRPAPRAALGVAGSAQLMVCVADIVSDGANRARVATALRVVGHLAPRHPELHLAVIGPGTLDEDLRMHAAALRITRLVHFVGERADELSLLRAADLGWVAAASDTAAYAMLDLMACRVPVLADRSPLSERYVSDGITGVLFPPGDASESAAAVARLLTYDEERAVMGAAGGARVARDFPLTATVDAFERVAQAAADRTRW